MWKRGEVYQGSPERGRAVLRAGPELVDGVDGEAVGAVVQRIARVSGDLVPGDLMALGFGDQDLPEVAVLDRLLLGVLPAVPEPALVPLVPKAIDDVRAIAVDADATRVVQRAQALEGAADLHALIGRAGLRAGQLALLIAVDDDGRPAAGPGIARARAIAVDRDGTIRRRHGRITRGCRGGLGARRAQAAVQ